MKPFINVLHGSIAGSKPLSQSCRQNSKIASAFRAIWAYSRVWNKRRGGKIWKNHKRRVWNNNRGGKKNKAYF